MAPFAASLAVLVLAAPVGKEPADLVLDPAASPEDVRAAVPRFFPKVSIVVVTRDNLAAGRLDLHRDGQTILLTTHYMEEADQLCDRVAIMDHGRILALDTPEGLKAGLGADRVVTVSGTGDLEALASHLLEGVEGVTQSTVTADGVVLHANDADGLLRYRGRWVTLSPVERALAAALVDRFGAVVGRDTLVRRAWPGGSPTRNALDVHMLRLRRRIGELALEVRTVRARGYLLQAMDAASAVGHAPSA